jgi:hypothetical protein
MSERFDPVPKPPAGLLNPIEVDEPPCRRCEFWRPIMLADPHGLYDGCRLCHASTMFRDFSCFKGKTW